MHLVADDTARGGESYNWNCWCPENWSCCNEGHAEGHVSLLIANSIGTILDGKLLVVNAHAYFEKQGLSPVDSTKKGRDDQKKKINIICLIGIEEQ